MIDAKGGNNLLYLPLDKLMAHTAGGEPQNASRQPSAGMASAANEQTQVIESNPRGEIRSRDSRDRETR
jgi:membrane protease subunit HflK